MKFDPRRLFSPDPQAFSVVPPSGFTAQLTLIAATAMAFLAVFALALSLASGRLADRWGGELAQSATIRIVASPDESAAQVETVLRILETTAGVAFARALDDAEQRALLAPWFGPDLDLSALPVPRLIEVIEEGEGFDATGLLLRLEAEAPDAVLDDHSRWRAPLVEAANRLRLLGWLCAVLIAVAVAVMVTLAAQAALAANASVIKVLRLVGATDRYIARAFIRRFAWRSFIGASLGTLLAMLAVLMLPEASGTGGFLTGLGFAGLQWLVPLAVPVLAALVAMAATALAAKRVLRGLA